MQKLIKKVILSYCEFYQNCEIYQLLWILCKVNDCKTDFNVFFVYLCIFLMCFHLAVFTKGKTYQLL